MNNTISEELIKGQKLYEIWFEVNNLISNPL